MEIVNLMKHRKNMMDVLPRIEMEIRNVQCGIDSYAEECGECDKLFARWEWLEDSIDHINASRSRIDVAMKKNGKWNHNGLTIIESDKVLVIVKEFI